MRWGIIGEHLDGELAGKLGANSLHRIDLASDDARLRWQGWAAVAMIKTSAPPLAIASWLATAVLLVALALLARSIAALDLGASAIASAVSIATLSLSLVVLRRRASHALDMQASQLALLDQTLRAVESLSCDALLEVDRTGIVRRFNPVLSQWVAGDLALATGWPLNRLFADPLAVSKAMATLTHPGADCRFSADLIGEAGRPRTVEVGAVAVSTLGAGVVAVCLRDDSQQSELRLEIERLRHHDPVTDLPNRRWLLGSLDPLLAAAAAADQRLALIVIDLVRFRRINDSLGHAVGDRVLAALAARLATYAAKGASVVHLGGDEFAVVCPDTDGAGAHQEARSLSALIEAPLEIEGQSLRLSGHFGIAGFPDDAVTGADLLHLAEQALDRARRSGRDVVSAGEVANTSHDPGLRDECRVHAAIMERTFVLHYQPIVALERPRVDHWEALLRWKGADTLISAGQFIGRAEALGLAGELDELVFDLLRDDMRDWARAAVRPRLAINVSAQTLLRTTSVALLLELAKSPLLINRLTVEVTETAFVADLESLAQPLRRLRDTGVRVAIDDFGSGNASVAYLRKLPVDILKIDMDLVRGAGRGDGSEKLLHAVILLGQSLGLPIVAEGVEEASQLDWLSSVGCTYAQGFLLGRPMPASAAHAWDMPRTGALSRRLTQPAQGSTVMR